MKYQLGQKVHYGFGRKLCAGEIIAVTQHMQIIKADDGANPPGVFITYDYLVRGLDNQRIRDYPEANIDEAEAKANPSIIDSMMEQYIHDKNLPD